MVVSELESMASSILLISIVILTWGFHAALCNKDIPVINNDSPIEMCIHFKSCFTGSMLQTCLKYDKKLTPAQFTNVSGIQNIYLEMFPTIVTSTFDTGGQVCMYSEVPNKQTDLNKQVQRKDFLTCYIKN